MTDQDKMELVSAAIDGELDVDERFALNALLESSAEARELKADLEELDAVLKKAPVLSAPESLHARIMAQVKPTPPPSKPSAMSWIRQLIPGAGLRYALTASAGALGALLIMNAQSPIPGSADISDLAGAMAPTSTTSSVDVVDTFSYQRGQLTSLVQLQVSNGNMILDIQAETEEPLSIDVDLGDAGLWPNAMKQIEGRARTVSISGQVVHIEALGSQRLNLFLGREDDAALADEASITLELSSGGRVLQQGVLTATR